MKRLTFLAAIAAVLSVPGLAQAAKPTQSTESVTVANGVITYTGGAATVDRVRLRASSGGAVVSETATPTGVIGAGCSALAEPSVYCGGASLAIQTLDLDDSIVNNSRLGGTLDGGAGDDTVTGGEAAETLRGGDGADVIAGGNGADTVEGGLGDDRIDVRDGVADAVDCGDGDDTVDADAADVLTSCEARNIVDGTNAGSGPGDTGPTPETSDPLTLPQLLETVTVAGPVTAHVAEGSAVAVKSNGRARFLLGCAADAASACSGVISIDPGASSKARKKGKGQVKAFMARRGRYGASPFRIKPGTENTLQIQLTTLAMRSLGKPVGRRARASRRGRRVRAVVTIAPKNARAQRVKITLKG